MKIAILSPTLPNQDYKPGGVDIMIHRFANELSKTREVCVFTLVKPPSDSLYKYKIIFNGNNWLGRNWFGRILIWPILINFINFKEFDVIHLHGDDWFYFWRTRPTVRTFHGSALLEAKTATSLKRKIAQYFIYFLEKISNQLATSSIVISPHTAKIYKNDNIIGHGVDLKQYYPGNKTKSPTILFVGTWLGRKRGKFLYDGFLEKILPIFPETKLIMVTDHCPIHESVIWSERPTDTELAKLYRQAWIFAYPSIYEGFGLCYLEAMASGTAIITSPNEGANYVLKNFKEKIQVNDNIFFETINNLIEKPAKIKKLINFGLTETKKFSWEKIVRQYIETYNDILRDKTNLKFNKYGK